MKSHKNTQAPSDDKALPPKYDELTKTPKLQEPAPPPPYGVIYPKFKNHFFPAAKKSGWVALEFNIPNQQVILLEDFKKPGWLKEVIDKGYYSSFYGDQHPSLVELQKAMKNKHFPASYGPFLFVNFQDSDGRTAKMTQCNTSPIKDRKGNGGIVSLLVPSFEFFINTDTPQFQLFKNNVQEKTPKP